MKYSTMKSYWYLIMMTGGFLLLSTNVSRAQSMDPAIQKMVDSLNTWMAQEIQETGTIDPVKLQEFNDAIKAEQEKIKAREEEAAKGTDSAADKKPGEEFKTIRKSGLVGSSFTVPEGKLWKVKRVLCSSGMGEYSVVVTSIELQESYKAGESITVPSYTAEASLLGEDASTMNYTYEIMEYDVK